jgi:hypothetical protein
LAYQVSRGEFFLTGHPAPAPHSSPKRQCSAGVFFKVPLLIPDLMGYTVISDAETLLNERFSGFFIEGPLIDGMAHPFALATCQSGALEK